jgi:hypothetical protein
MFGSLGDMAGMMKKAGQMKAEMERFKEQLKQERFDAEAGGGLVKATVNGQGDLVDIKIAASAVDDVELLEDLVKSSIGAASKKAQDSQQAKMSQMMGGLNIPGLDGLLGGGG